MISFMFPLSMGVIFLMLKDFFFFSSIFSMDFITIFMVCIFPLIFSLVSITSSNFTSSLEKDTFSFIFMLVFFFLFFCFCSDSPFIFLIFLENCVILMFSAIIFFSKDLDKVSSTLFMFFINIFPSIMFMSFCSHFPQSKEFMHFKALEANSFLSLFCFLGLLVSKLPLFTFHFWLTKAHVSASGCGSMILASLMLKIGSMGLIKFYYLFHFLSLSFSEFFYSLVVYFSLLLLIVMTRFFDMKYLVACSSIIHMAPLFCLVLRGDSPSFLGSCLMQVGHGLVSYFIFFVITLIYEGSHHRSIDQNKNISSCSFLLFFFLFLFFLLNMGFPPFCSLISELYFLFSFYSFDSMIFSILCVTMIPSGIFFFLVLSKSIFGKKVNLNIQDTPSHFYMISLVYFFFFLLIPYFFF